MLLRCGLLLAVLSCVRTYEDYHQNEFGDVVGSFNTRYALWPSFLNAAKMMRIRREVTKEQTGDLLNVEGQSEGGAVKVLSGQAQGKISNNTDYSKLQSSVNQTNANPEAINVNRDPPNKSGKGPTPQDNNNVVNSKNLPAEPTKESKKLEPTSSPAPTSDKDHSASSGSTSAPIIDAANTTTVEKVKDLDLSNPAAMKRGLIVFGGFALLAIAYFIFYRTKSKYNEANNSNGPSESNQFRYGVLQSDDRRDNLELSRVPLTMESDEEEDEDLEIFDLEEKKKSLSYVNLQTNDEDIVLSPQSRDERDDLLLDIEDENSDVLINWSSNTNRSIL